MKDGSIPHGSSQSTSWKILLLVKNPIPSCKHSCQHKFSKSGEEEDAPVEAKDVDKLHPLVVLVPGVLDKLTRGLAANLTAVTERGQVTRVIGVVDLQILASIHTSFTSIILGTGVRIILKRGIPEYL